MTEQYHHTSEKPTEPKHTRKPYGPWTEEALTMLSSLAAENLSSGAISERLWIDRQISVSRNAVIGKLNRLGIHLIRGKPAKHHPRKHIRPCPPQGAHPLRSVEEIEGLRMPRLLKCSLLELTQCSCRWPFGEPGRPDFFFCGGAAIKGKPYCEEHLNLAWA